MKEEDGRWKLTACGMEDGGCANGRWKMEDATEWGMEDAMGWKMEDCPLPRSKTRQERDLPLLASFSLEERSERLLGRILP